MEIFISLVLALISFSIGLSLTVSDFRRVIKGWKRVGIGLALQIFYLPVCAIIVLACFDLDPRIEVGIFLISICPGGTSSNLIVFITEGNTALSVSLTAVNSFIILFTVPLLLSFGVNYYMGSSEAVTVSVAETFIQVLLVLILPVVAGVLLRQWREKWFAAVLPLLKKISVVLLGVVFLLKTFASPAGGGTDLDVPTILALLPVCLIFHLFTLFSAYAITGWLIKSRKDRATISIEVGLQNTGLALLVNELSLQDPLVAQPAIVYALFTFFTTLAFGWWLLQWKREEESPATAK